MLKCTDKSQQSILQNAMAEKYGKIQRTQQNTLKQTIRITWRRQGEMHFSKRCKFQSTLIIQRRNKTYLNKISKSNQLVVELDLEPNCKRFSKGAIWENLQIKTSRTDKKNSIRTAVHQYPTTQWRKSEVYPSSFNYVWKTFGTSFTSCTHLKMFKFFLVSAGQNYVSDTRRDTID